MKIVPSLLAADFVTLERDLDTMREAGFDALHYDVMDGCFVPAIALGDTVLPSLRRHTDFFLDAHLMVREPERFAESYRKIGADGFTFHVEATTHPEELLRDIRQLGMRAGVALNPETPVEAVIPLLPLADLILVMTVHPGLGGQKYLPFCTEKIRKLCTLRTESGVSCLIQADGGIYPSNISMLQAAGLDEAVAGTAVFRGDIKENWKAFKEAIK